jgi:hypothetical protein
MSALSEHYAGKECPGDFTDEDIANLSATIWFSGADHETADFVARQLLRRGLRLVPIIPTSTMIQEARYAANLPDAQLDGVYQAMLKAAPRA